MNDHGVNITLSKVQVLPLIFLHWKIHICTYTYMFTFSKNEFNMIENLNPLQKSKIKLKDKKHNIIGKDRFVYVQLISNQTTCI